METGSCPNNWFIIVKNTSGFPFRTEEKHVDKYQFRLCCVWGSFEVVLFLLWFPVQPGRCVLLLALWATWLSVWLRSLSLQGSDWGFSRRVRSTQHTDTWWLIPVDFQPLELEDFCVSPLRCERCAPFFVTPKRRKKTSAKFVPFIPIGQRTRADNEI